MVLFLLAPCRVGKAEIAKTKPSNFTAFISPTKLRGLEINQLKPNLSDPRLDIPPKFATILSQATNSNQPQW
jgi:hypothetical protein